MATLTAPLRLLPRSVSLVAGATRISVPQPHLIPFHPQPYPNLVPPAFRSRSLHSSIKATAETSSSSKLTEPTKDGEAKALPVLPRPLGVEDPPEARSRTWKEQQADLMDQNKRRAKRKALIQEATRGYFHDFNALRNPASHGGKTWIAPPLLIREDKALYLPNLTGTTLKREKKFSTDLIKGKVALVSVLTTRISEEHVNSFVSEPLSDWEEDPQFTYVQINHQPNPLKSMLLQLFISSLRRSQKESRWDSYMIVGGEWGELAEPLGISNKHVGYTYLVDQNLKIRWAGCAYANDEERWRLRRSVAVLMKRLKGESEASIQASAAADDEGRKTTTTTENEGMETKQE